MHLQYFQIKIHVMFKLAQFYKLSKALTHYMKFLFTLIYFLRKTTESYVSSFGMTHMIYRLQCYPYRSMLKICCELTLKTNLVLAQNASASYPLPAALLYIALILGRVSTMYKQLELGLDLRTQLIQSSSSCDLPFSPDRGWAQRSSAAPGQMVCFRYSEKNIGGGGIFSKSDQVLLGGWQYPPPK